MTDRLNRRHHVVEKGTVAVSSLLKIQSGSTKSRKVGGGLTTVTKARQNTLFKDNKNQPLFKEA